VALGRPALAIGGAEAAAVVGDDEARLVVRRPRDLDQWPGLIPAFRSPPLWPRPATAPTTRSATCATPARSTTVTTTTPVTTTASVTTTAAAARTTARTTGSP
jgi:hypothetical protein